VTNGVIAGAIDTMTLLAAVKAVAGHIQSSFCSGSAFDSIAVGISQASDILIEDGKVVNHTGATCNAISLGMGFDATEIAIPAAADVLAKQAPATDPCANTGDDGGMGDSGSDTGATDSGNDTGNGNDTGAGGDTGTGDDAGAGD
jgi:hypothetical protein